VCVCVRVCECVQWLVVKGCISSAHPCPRQMTVFLRDIQNAVHAGLSRTLALHRTGTRAGRLTGADARSFAAHRLALDHALGCTWEAMAVWGGHRSEGRQGLGLHDALQRLHSHCGTLRSPEGVLR
jgi:hypothetical protein